MREPSGGLITTKGRCRLKWVSELISLNGTWDLGKIWQFFLPVDVVEIQKIKLSPQLDEDFAAWAPEKNGLFSVRSAYKLASDEAYNSRVASTSGHPDGTRDGWNYIWKSSAPPKVQSFAWRLGTDSLATWTNKAKRNLEIITMCPVCGWEAEDSFHALCICDHAAQLWKAMESEWSLPDRKSIKPVGLDWFFMFMAELSDEEKTRIMLLFWRIWYARNVIVHGKLPPPVDVSVRFLASYLCSLQNLCSILIDTIKGKAVMNGNFVQK